jgi:hypothetical protein
MVAERCAARRPGTGSGLQGQLVPLNRSELRRRRSRSPNGTTDGARMQTVVRDAALPATRSFDDRAPWSRGCSQRCHGLGATMSPIASIWTTALDGPGLPNALGVGPGPGRARGSGGVAPLPGGSPRPRPWTPAAAIRPRVDRGVRTVLERPWRTWTPGHPDVGACGRDPRPGRSRRRRRSHSRSTRRRAEPRSEVRDHVVEHPLDRPGNAGVVGRPGGGVRDLGEHVQVGLGPVGDREHAYRLRLPARGQVGE